MGKAAYLRWREDLKRMASGVVTRIMCEEGFSEGEVARVDQLIMKKALTSPEGQVVEDALVLVFLERQFADFRLKETDDKMVDILRKSWKKMGPKGQAAALTLPLSGIEAELVGRALAPAPTSPNQG
ncbi:MAG: hypothetical protein WDW38_003518 [Sanguina aurantia]